MVFGTAVCIASFKSRTWYLPGDDNTVLLYLYFSIPATSYIFWPNMDGHTIGKQSLSKTYGLL